MSVVCPSKPDEKIRLSLHVWVCFASAAYAHSALLYRGRYLYWLAWAGCEAGGLLDGLYLH